MTMTAGTWSHAADLAAAPPPFVWNGKTVVPVAFSRYELTLDIDVAERRARGHARIRFAATQPGCPLLDMVPRPSRITLDGKSIPVARFPEIVPPDQQAPLRMLDAEVAAGRDHELAIEYELTDGTVSFADNGVQLDFFMSDLDERGYLEHHAPSNLEFNQFPLSVVIRLAGSGAARPPRLFTNGTATAMANGWTIDFPPHFCASSFFLHLSDRDFKVQEDTFPGLERAIPLLAYGERAGEVKRAIKKAKTVLAELEKAYGPYAHDRLTIYVTRELDDGEGGMEYCGATMTGLGALEHELFHSWFARGVMPANGNAGWIDEGLASWRDSNYPRKKPDPNRDPINLAAFSPYCRHTPDTSYEYGGLLFSELDHLFRKDGAGLRPVLRALYEDRKGQQITTEYFRTFLEQRSGRDLGEMFTNFVYGRPLKPTTPARQAESRARTEKIIKDIAAKAAKHRSYTRAELKARR